MDSGNTITTTIAVERTNKTRLTLRKRAGESYDDVIDRLLTETRRDVPEEQLEEIRSVVEQSPVSHTDAGERESGD